jgi:3-oxoacyl-(acyl-carrier-protein) synthase
VQTPISITNISSISALGNKSTSVWESYKKGKSLFTNLEDVPVSKVSSEIEQEITQLQNSKPAYKNLDRSVLLAILTAKNGFNQKENLNKNVGINIGSSRGATALFEKYHEQFQQKGKVSPFSSPTTTLGNISSWVGQELGVNGVEIGHSVTCSTALHAVLNGIAWLQADMAEVFIAGGSEAALTPFTIAQVKAMKLYSTLTTELPCESLKFPKKKNSMILGEGAAIAVLKKGVKENAKALITGFGFASETLEHNSSISENATCFQNSMKMALDKAGLKTVDAIVMHAPGTAKGDQAEKNAIDIVFKQIPLLTSNKWMMGHTFGASGIMSLELAVLILQNNELIENPFYKNEKRNSKELKTMMVNAVGFGGNAVSIIVEKV